MKKNAKFPRHYTSLQRNNKQCVCMRVCVCLFQLAEMSNDNKCDLPYVYVKILASKMTKKTNIM